MVGKEKNTIFSLEDGENMIEGNDVFSNMLLNTIKISLVLKIEIPSTWTLICGVKLRN
jgi:hypothetical protein